MYHEVVDVTEDAAVQAFCRSAAGALDVVNQFVNTVGVVDNMGDVVDLAPKVWVSAVSLKTWREVFAVNVEAALTASQQAAVRQMSRPGRCCRLTIQKNPRNSQETLDAF